jgi:hypothetical protein
VPKRPLRGAKKHINVRMGDPLKCRRNCYFPDLSQCAILVKRRTPQTKTFLGLEKKHLLGHCGTALFKENRA